MENLTDAVVALDGFKDPSLSLFWKDSIRAGVNRMSEISETLKKAAVSNEDAWTFVKEAEADTDFARGYARLNSLREQVNNLQTELLNAARQAIAPQIPEEEATAMREEFKGLSADLDAFNTMAERLVAPKLQKDPEKNAAVLAAFEYLRTKTPNLRGAGTGGVKATATVNPDTAKIRKFAKEILQADVKDRGRIDEKYVTAYYEAKNSGNLPEAYA